jgi:drug/metabolite transporter (DMT)-like permease
MIAVVLALGAAVVWGTGDFFGGLATRRTGPLAVTTLAHAVGLCLVLAALPLFPPEVWSLADLQWGALAGVFGGVGLVFLYWGLGVGPMSVVAPVTALTAAALPVVAGLGMGERPAPIALLGIAAALTAIALVTWPRGTSVEERAVRPGVIGLALTAGVGFGVFFIVLDQTSADAGLWPLVGARLGSLALLGGVVVAGRVSIRPAPGSIGLILWAGVLDMLANVLYLLAVRQGLLAVVSVLAALYPVSTVILAQMHLSERLQRAQLAGLGTAVLAAAFIAAG